ncbi:MAG TPA: kojibiose phosphorylase [Lachnoclostridium phytofermentans]|uniref:Kojibiose phosphorylase n=1 Tax=Lachnoclostridium phytofermentans TaxID=66219 RepID=A0A3D2X324_9FIRM|nr:glycosyl hydrolase family 65 protein [Lachnoclostridium sp.]HCL01376.1 kojibiose phosphorylase [Lachnoclostridium phytofermentans]
MDWTLTENGYDSNLVTTLGNKFFIGNGYMGIRGTLEEYEKDQLVAINLSGIYDQVGEKFREPINAPNALYTYIEIAGERIGLPDSEMKSHQITLDFSHGLFGRKTSYPTKHGEITVESERFCCMEQPHIICMKYCIHTNADMEVTLVSGIDADVWDINGPHLNNVKFSSSSKEENTFELSVHANTSEKKLGISVWEIASLRILDDVIPDCLEQRKKQQYTHEVVKAESKILNRFTISLSANGMVCFYKYIGIYIEKDSDLYERENKDLLHHALLQGYGTLKSDHIEWWKKCWERDQVLIEGDEEAMQALNYSLYHLISIAPRHSKSMSIPARGLSGQTYKGAVFWDTEMFLLPFYLYTEPMVARSLVKYRIDTLEGAKKKAKEYGYLGAFYAWESQEGGYEACSDYNVIDVFTERPMRTYFRDKQIHISSAVVYGLMSYVHTTNDYSILEEGGVEVVFECAQFYYSMLLQKVPFGQFELHDVVGPDEYHERVNNNFYTNRMAKYTFDMAVELIQNVSKLSQETQNKLAKQYGLSALLTKFEEASKRIFIKIPDKYTKLVEQFDGYYKLKDTTLDEVRSKVIHPKEYWGGAYGVAADTKIIKQADVVTTLALFRDEYEQEVLQKNWDYYEPRTEHGSSLSACMYALLACYCDNPDEAYPFFLKSAMADLKGGGKEWAGLLYIGGTHPAAAGGAYMTAVYGFAGLTIKEGSIAVKPCLPSSITKLSFSVQIGGKKYRVTVTKEDAFAVLI